MYNLFLDDERQPLDVLNFIDDNIYEQLQWHVVRNSNDFKSVIVNKGIPNLVSFDNDIQDFSDNGNEITGYMLAKWLVDYCIDNYMKFPFIVKAHTRNIVDRPNILAVFNNAAIHYPELV